MENDSFGSSSSDPDSMGGRPIMMQNSSSDVGDGSTSDSSSSSSALSSSSSSEEEEDEKTHRALHARAIVVSKAADQTSGAPNLKSRLEKSGGGSSERAKDSGLRGRVWSEEDEIALLQGIRDNQKKTGRQPSEDLTALLTSLQGKLTRDMSKTQVYEKIRRLKNKFFIQTRDGKKLESGDNHISKVFLLSKNIWGSDSSSTEMKEVASDLMVESVLQELNATADVGVENNMKQQEFNCSTGSSLGGTDDPVACARESSIFATKDECPADHNTTSKTKNTLTEQEKESEEQNKEIAQGSSTLRTLDPEVGILQNIGPEDDKALHARSGNNDMSHEGARNQQTEESTVNMFSHGVCVEAACPSNLVESFDVRSEDGDKKTKKRKKAKHPNEDSSSNDNVQEKINQKAINGSMVQIMPEERPAYDKFPHGVSEVAACPNNLVQPFEIRSEDSDRKNKKRKKTKLSKRKSLGEDSFDNVQEKIDQSTNGRSAAQNPTEQKQAHDKGTDPYARKKKKTKEEIKGDKNIQDLHEKASQKSTSSNVNFIAEELAADEPNREIAVPEKEKKNKQEIKDNENVENVHARSNDDGKDNKSVKNLLAKSNDDSIVEVPATGESHGELATLGRKSKKEHKQETTGDKNVDYLQTKPNDDSIVDVPAAGEPHGEVADPGRKMKKKMPKQEVKDNDNVENLHGKLNNDLIMEMPAADEPDGGVAQRKKVQVKKKKKEEIKEKNLYAKANDGLIIEVLAAGQPDGEVAAFGKKVGIFYTVRIKGSGSVIDSNVGGKPLKFCIGDEKVVKGWSIGVNGMHIGEKRRVTFPPSMGYGKRFAEVIPENSWVEGDIELVSVC